MAVTTCKDTPLHLVRALPVPLPETVPYLGVGEFAVRRGRTYATILVDTNTHRPMDVLADRTAHTFAAWLREHSEVRSSAVTAPAPSSTVLAPVHHRPGKWPTPGICCTTSPGRRARRRTTPRRTA
ncbi:transposase [Streptomyces mirabilis]|uniref:transposase n=1 Tax=Streptomyces mirabilis TaxID=68239 RepID=UPI0036F34E27